MTKNRSKMLIIFLSLILIVGLVASFVSFTYPLSIGGVKYKYSSFANELVLGSDISEGVLFDYQAKVREDGDTDNYDKLRNQTVEGLKDILDASGFKNSTVALMGDNSVRVEVGGIINQDDVSDVTSLIGSPEQLIFSSSSSVDDKIAGSEILDSVKAKSMANGVQTVNYVEFTINKTKYNNGIKTAFNDVIKDGGSVYVLLGDQQIATLGGSDGQLLETNILTITSDNFVDLATAEQYAVSIRVGMLPLELICTYHGTISASSGVRGNVANPMLYIWIALGLMVVATIVLFVLRYKQIGLMAIFNMLFYIVLGLFFLQSIPLVHINLSGVFAIVIGYIMAVVALTNTLENARHEYAKGKKLHTSLRQGINSTVTSTITVNAMLALGGIICALMPNMAIQSFGIVTMVLGLLNIFCSQALMRLMIKLYLPFNAEDGKKCNFTREELKDVK